MIMNMVQRFANIFWPWEYLPKDNKYPMGFRTVPRPWKYLHKGYLLKYSQTLVIQNIAYGYFIYISSQRF